MNFTPEQLQANYQELMGVIEKYFDGERKQKLTQLYTDHEERIMMMPASGTVHYHNCFTGGYVDHVLRVIRCALQVKALWEAEGAVINYTDEELVFAALNHDLGKIGSEEAEQYIHNPSDWHRKNQGKLYINNPANSFMIVPDRSLKLLADRGIKVSENEWYGIKLHDGMYEEANKPYYVGWNPDSALRTNISYVLHQADMMASRIEKETNHSAEEAYAPAPKAKKSTTLKEAAKESLKNTFDQLFK
jgi:hypothetical protein